MICSGGGFFTKSGSSAWHLRGIVSSSLFDSDGRCDVTKYAVFTNVVKYTDWVRKIVEKKISRTKFEFERVDGETKLEAYSYKTEYHHLNGTSEAAK